MPAIKPAAEIAEKWARVTPGRSDDYRSGVASPEVDWEAATVAAESAYEQGVQESIGKKRFSKGVKAAGTSKWQKKAIDVGVPRWGAGITAAVEDYQKGFAPYRDIIERTTLPRRGPRGSRQNYERVIAMGQALHEAKVGS